MPKQWPLNDAKTHLSTVVDQAQESPQLITRHGKAAAVVISPEAYEALTGRQSAWDVLKPAKPILEADDAFERLSAGPRNVDFDD